MRVGQYSVKHWGRTAVYDHNTIKQKIGAGLNNGEIAAEMECSVRVVENVRQKIDRRRRIV